MAGLIATAPIGSVAVGSVKGALNASSGIREKGLVGPDRFKPTIESTSNPFKLGSGLGQIGVAASAHTGHALGYTTAGVGTKLEGYHSLGTSPPVPAVSGSDSDKALASAVKTGSLFRKAKNQFNKAGEHLGAIAEIANNENVKSAVKSAVNTTVKGVKTVKKGKGRSVRRSVRRSSRRSSRRSVRR